VNTLARLFQEADSAQDYARRYADHLSDLLHRLDYAALDGIVEAFEAASRAGATVYFAANGGSAAAATHWVNDLVAGAYQGGQPGFRAVSLADNVATVTALGNDAGYENVFVRQLQVMMDPQDLLYVMSVSGNSENVLRAVDYAKSIGAKSIGIAGMDGGKLLERCDIALHVPATPDEYGPVEDVFAVLEHMISGYLTMRRGKFLHH
jgi:D-sedoheptulose 7-phosphate isomerase